MIIFKCSPKCGPGLQTRPVECYGSQPYNLNEPLKETYCEKTAKPKNSQPCNKTCNDNDSYEWTITSKGKVIKLNINVILEISFIHFTK